MSGLVAVAKRAAAARQLKRRRCEDDIPRIVCRKNHKDRAIQALDSGGGPGGRLQLHLAKAKAWERFKGNKTPQYLLGVWSLILMDIYRLDLSHVGPLARHQIRFYLQQIGHPVMGQPSTP